MKTFNQIAQQLSLEEREEYSPQRVHIIYKRAIRKMRAVLERKGLQIEDLLSGK